MHYINTVIRSISRLVVSLDMTEWAVLAICLIGIGVLCMRGYGSRSTY